jgi:hypothetical protein
MSKTADSADTRGYHQPIQGPPAMHHVFKSAKKSACTPGLGDNAVFNFNPDFEITLGSIQRNVNSF